eukprot:scaffold4062_cov49-Attheya_sp.AAC.2
MCVFGDQVGAIVGVRMGPGNIIRIATCAAHPRKWVFNGDNGQHSGVILGRHSHRRRFIMVPP